MNKLKRKNGSQISPYIAAKIRYELGISTKKPINQKNCSNDYWNEVVEIIGASNGISKSKIKSIVR
jgi:hypothetical protein